MGKATNQEDYIKGYKKGVEDGKKDAMIKLQEMNFNEGLPSNETLYKIFELLEKVKKQDADSHSLYMNAWEHYANYITQNW